MLITYAIDILNPYNLKMCDLKQESQQDDSEHNSDDNLKIVLDSPKPKRKFVRLQPSRSKKQIIASIEDERKQRIDKKAAKTKLKVANVKSVFKQVVTDKHVLAMVKNAEDRTACVDSIPYEPKLTRAKAKELVAAVAVPPVPWSTPKSTSRGQVLFDEDLQEDSSIDEYVSCKEEIEDDRYSSGISNPPSIPPPAPETPTPNQGVSIQTNLTKDGVFKITSIKKEKTDIEDEEQDLEYEILADEDIEEIVKEESVKNEFFECSELCTGHDVDEACPQHNVIKNCVIKQDVDAKPEIIEAAMPNSLGIVEKAEVVDISEESVMENISNPNDIEEDNCKNIMITKTQIPLLEQQMRQHVQMLTQNFILTYMHPELHHCSIRLKEYLLNLKFLCQGKEQSAFYAVNLTGALNLVKYWEVLLASDREEVKEMKQYVEKVLTENIQRKKIGSASEYIATFPPLILETISRSEVFLYPSLLPKIPFKSPKVFPKYTLTYTESEDQLIALGFEQFKPLLKHDRKNLTHTGQVKQKVICAYIQEYMMPHKDASKLLYHVMRYKLPHCASNPIKYYFQNEKAPPFFHYIHPLDQLKILPPCKRLPEELPYQWKMHIYPPKDNKNNNTSIGIINISPLQAASTLIFILPVVNNSIVTP